MWFLALISLGLSALALWQDWRRSELEWWDFVILKIARIYSQIWHRWTRKTPVPFPEHGPALIIANHTCSADPAFLLASSRRAISFLVAGEHYRIHPFIEKLLDHLGCVAVKRTGQEVVGLRQGLAKLRQGRLLCIFPEGNLSGVANKKMRRPKLGAAFLALHTRVPVYPVYISGGPHTHDLLQSWLRFSQKPVRVRFGPPIDLSAYYDQPRTKRLYEEMAALLMGRVQELGNSSKG